MIYIIDNYDSFTYNLADYIARLGFIVEVENPTTDTLKKIEQRRPSHLIISPGPNGPQDATISIAAIQQFYQTIPILGVCLGHQCLGYAFGAKIIQSAEIIHGDTSLIWHNKQRLFQNIPNPFQATRYHSLAIDCTTLPDYFSIDAWADKETIMAISHRQYPVFGVQFHPEAILTEHGLAILNNFCNYSA